MGAPKALLDAAGETFLRRVVRTLLEGGADPVVVVVRDPDGAEADEARAAGARVEVNPEPDHPVHGGPASSLRVGLAALPPAAAGTLLHPVDHPRVQVATIQALIEDFRRHEAPVTAPTCGGRRGHPVLLASAVFAELLDTGLAEGARTVVRRHAPARREVPVADPGVLDDLDTRAAYRRAYPAAADPTNVRGGRTP
jgi:CTP:molybdopterin cytidylyltransferase MocA